MARKKTRPGAAAASALPVRGDEVVRPISALPVLPTEATGTGTVALFALMMLLAPALGVPHEELLQDTLKSVVVSFAALAAALAFFWQQRRGDALRWHGVMWLPLLLMAYALGSMAWSHTYLAAVETIRWFIFALILWLGLNTLTRSSLPALALGIHAGAVVASLWAVLQFAVDLRLFPQGPPPASTFVNRNFFAEFAVCTLPFGAVLLARARQSAQVALLAASSGLVIVAILMTGTRAALVALWLQLLVVLPYLGWLYRRHYAFPDWSRGTQVLAAGVLVATVAGLGLITTGNAKIVEEGRGLTALERGFKRTGSISVDDHSLGIRLLMWKATGRVIAQRPLSGVGAGAWENEVPLYQDEGAQLETDYYVHNEYLQLLAEYGLAGWLFLLALGAWLLAAVGRTLLDRAPAAQAEAPWRSVFLCSLLAFLVVSSIGFPWRMATTGALFALCLAALAASDARLGVGGRWAALRMPWRPAYAHAAVAVSIAALAVAAVISQLAADSEREIVKATKIALTISASGDPQHARWDKSKAEMLTRIREGVAINPHYRKITPMVADELAKWGDWANATWIWESVLSSRPHVVAILANVARGHTALGNNAKAFEYLERARKVQPRAPAVRSLEVVLLSRAGREAQALDLVRNAIAEGQYDYDMINTAAVLAWRAGDHALAVKAVNLRMAGWPASRPQGLVQLGTFYASGLKDPVKALQSFQQAKAISSESQWRALSAQIPAEYRAQVGLPGETPKRPEPAQTSASKG